MEARETTKANRRENGVNPSSWNKNDWYKNDWNKSSWYNKNPKGKGKGGKGKDSKGKGQSKSKKVASVEESETSMAQEHQPEPEYSADIATLFAIEMEKAVSAAISRGAAEAKAQTEVKATRKKPGTGKRSPWNCRCWDCSHEPSNPRGHAVQP